MVDACDTDAASGERHGDPAGTDRKLQGSTRGERLEEIDGRLDGRGLEVRAGRFVVAHAGVVLEPGAHSGSFRRTLIEMARVTYPRRSLTARMFSLPVCVQV